GDAGLADGIAGGRAAAAVVAREAADADPPGRVADRGDGAGAFGAGVAPDLRRVHRRPAAAGVLHAAVAGADGAAAPVAAGTAAAAAGAGAAAAAGHAAGAAVGEHRVAAMRLHVAAAGRALAVG